MTTQILPDGTDSRAETARNTAWAIATRIYDAHPRDHLADALTRLNTLPDTDTCLPDRQLVCAEYLTFVLGDTDFGAELAADIDHAAPAMLLGLDIGNYRPDPRTASSDDDLDGYDWSAIALDLARLWDRRAGLIAREKVESLSIDRDAA